MNPVNDYFLPYQREWILDDSPMKFYAKSRRIGITYATSFRVNDKCLRRRNFTQWVTSRDELTAHEFITDYIARWAKSSNAVCRGLLGDDLQVIDAEKGIRAFVATYESTGSRVVSLSSTPEAFAGKGGDVLIDEADLHKDSGKVIDMAMPCTTWGNQLEILSALSVDGGPNTPFCRLERDILENGNPMGWSHHRTSILDAVEQGFVEKINEVTGQHYGRQEWLAMIRAKCRTEEAWNTQYLIQPGTDGAALLSYELIASCEIPSKEAVREADGAHLSYAGFDVGRKKDLSVYFELEKRGDVLWQVEYEVLDRVGFPAQIRFLKDKMRNPKLARLCIDCTGMGGPVCEEVQRGFGQYRVEGVTFTNPVKEALAMPLRAAFEDRTIRIADDPAIRDDLHKIRKTMTAAGNIRYEGERDEQGHSDRFWALALALHAKGGNDGPCRMEALNAHTETGNGYDRPDNTNDWES
jgi:phage FluMu gp28-like protein